MTLVDKADVFTNAHHRIHVVAHGMQALQRLPVGVEHASDVVGAQAVAGADVAGLQAQGVVGAAAQARASVGAAIRSSACSGGSPARRAS